MELKGKYPINLICSFSVEVVKGKPEITGCSISIEREKLKVVDDPIEGEKTIKVKKQMILNDYWNDFDDAKLIREYLKEWER